VSEMVQTPRGAGTIVESDTVRGRTSHLVAGIGFKQWFPETQVRVASLEDGYMPIPEDEFPGNPYGEALPAMPPEGMDPEMEPGMEMGGPEEGIGDILDGLSEFAATGELSPEDQIQYSGSPDEGPIYASRDADGYFLGGPGDHVDDSNSVRLPYNPDPQHDATYSTPDASWGPGEYTIDADERLHPSNSLTLNDVPHSEAGDEPGPANHLFAAQQCEFCGQPGHSWEVHPEAHADVAAWDRERAGLEEPFGQHFPQAALSDREAALRLYGPAPKLGSKYATPLLYQAADHFNDPVQMFRDDSHGFIERRGSNYSENDAELDRYAALLDSDRTIRTAAWNDVQRKAKRLRREGKVAVKDIGPDRIYATVQGDTGTYETMITKGSSLGGYDAYGPHGGQQVGNWHCSCKWGNWAFKRRFTFIGRLCSHGLASYWEMQAAHNTDDRYVDKRRNKVKTKRAWVADADDRPVHRDRGLGEIIDHYGPHDKIDREQEFDRRTDLAQEYAEATDLPGDADDVPLGYYARRTADFLRTTPRGMVPQLNHIPREREHSTVDVTSLDDTDMLGAAAEGTEREAAMLVGRRVVAWIVDEVLPQFEEWYKRNHGRQLDQARPTEASQAAAEFAHEVGLDQATTEMLQEFINQDFGPEDMEDEEPTEEIKHFTAAAGRYLLLSARTAAPYDPMDLLNPSPTAGEYDSQNPMLVPFNGLQTGNPMTDPLTGPGAGYAADSPGGTGLPWIQDGAGGGAPEIGLNTNPGGTTQAPANPGTTQAAPEVDLAAAETDTAGGGSTYTVKPGDTLSDIAAENGLGSDWQSLYDTNRDVVGDDADLILPGQELTLPGGEHDGTGAAPGPSTAPVQGPGLNGDAPAAPTSTAPEGAATDVTSLAGGGSGGSSGAPSVPDLIMPTGPSTNTSTELTGSHHLASDESLINHLRDLSSRGVEAKDYGSMAQRNSDVRKTVDELRDRGYDANQLVAAISRTAAPTVMPASGGYATIPADNGGESESVSGGSQTDPEASQVQSPTDQAATGGAPDLGGIGADFMQMLPGLASGIGGGIGAIGDALSGMGGGAAGLGGLASGVGGALSGILGAKFADGESDEPLLGYNPPEGTQVPTGFAGSGPDKQSWASSSEDYVEEYESDLREDIDSFDGNITRYSAFDAAMRQASAFDDYANWAYAKSGGSQDASDWDSVEAFLSESEGRQDGVTSLEPARDLIKNHLEFRASRQPYYAAGNSGYFGVGAQPGYPSADGLSHSNGAANLKGVTKPKKIKPPKPPALHQAPPQPAQLFQPPPQGGAPLAQPRQPMVQGPGGSGVNALGKPKRTEGGIARQGQQLQAGVLNSAFGEMGVPDPGMVAAYGHEPQYHEAGAFPTVMGGGQPGYSGVPDYQPPNPTQHLGGFGWDPLPGQNGAPNEVPLVRQAGPVDAFGSKMLAAHMGTAAPQQQDGQYYQPVVQQHIAHDQQAAQAMGEYRTPHVASYGQTNDASDVVRQFQAQMGGGWMSDYQPTGPGGGYGMGMPDNARTAGRVYSLAEQAALEQEQHLHGARNLGELDLRGTHYLGEA